MCTYSSLDDIIPSEPVIWTLVDGTPVGMSTNTPSRDLYTCGIYTRVSTSRQGVKGLGVASQRGAILDFLLKTHDKVLVVQEVSEARSGATGDNATLLDFIVILGRTRPRADLCVFTTDRVSRSEEQTGEFRSTLRKNKVNVVYRRWD